MIVIILFSALVAAAVFTGLNIMVMLSEGDKDQFNQKSRKH